VIDTEQYEEWGGGHGLGSAIFWDLCRDKMIDGFDPRNIITIMTSPLSGTLAPGVSGRCEVQGIGVQAYPVGWFTKSNFGGRFCGMLKAAGWDGIVIEGAAEAPVWVNIINDKVTFEDARGLWGVDTWETQQKIWQAVTGQAKFGEWVSINGAQTTQRPAVLCTGPAGEHLSRSAILLHETGHGASQGGFGAVWGAKNLKAISVQGTGSIKIADPRALMDARLWFDRNSPYYKDEKVGAAGCVGCPKLCSQRNQKYGNGSSCIEPMWYVAPFDAEQVDPEVANQAGDMAQRYGVNICDLALYLLEFTKGGYLLKLHDMGILGPGKAIDSAPLPWDKLWKLEFAEALIKAIAYREGIGNDLAEGPSRAARKWGRLEEDLASGILPAPQWGYVWHWSLPGVEWCFGSVLGDRDICDHDFEFHVVDKNNSEPNVARKRPTGVDVNPDELTPENFVELLASKTIPYTGLMAAIWLRRLRTASIPGTRPSSSPGTGTTPDSGNSQSSIATGCMPTLPTRIDPAIAGIPRKPNQNS
jgi:aldehyde:ferredoxin oxidoreductase